ncbi:hypothetical protein KM043_002612 [Ampulex compressa]|nr:hypothetical protein KM043_002612 [Ampulex compressa]
MSARWRNMCAYNTIVSIRRSIKVGRSGLGGVDGSRCRRDLARGLAKGGCPLPVAREGRRGRGKRKTEKEGVIGVERWRRRRGCRRKSKRPQRDTALRPLANPPNT